MRMQNRSFRTRAAATAAAAIVSMMVAGQAQAGTTSDAWITSKAKLNLMTTEGVSSNAINVDTVNRQITLHGTVGTAEEKAKAEQSVKSVAGVTSVRNL